MIGSKMYWFLVKVRLSIKYRPKDSHASYLLTAQNRNYLDYHCPKNKKPYFTVSPTGDDAMSEYRRNTLQYSVTVICSILSLFLSALAIYITWFTSK